MTEKALKVYIASNFESRENVREIYKRLISIGCQIAYDWTTHIPITPFDQYTVHANKYSDEELEAIRQTDIFIYISNEKGMTSNMEFGAALLLAMITGKPEIYVVGNVAARSPWFFNRRVIRKNTIDEVIDELGRKQSIH